MNLKQNIISFAKNNNIDKIGFCNAEPFYNIKNVLLERLNKGFLSGFEEKDIEKRINPKLTLENSQSIIVIAENYYKKFDFEEDNKLRGNFSLVTIGEDYHKIVKNKLEILAKYITSIVENVEYKICVDTGSLIDKEIAKRAGIGFFGKNNLIITPEFGSWVFIGYILINIFLEPDKEININCNSCNKCIISCPTGALKNNYDFDAKKCISYLTQSNEIPDSLIDKMSTELYGCDICQQVCIHNKNAIAKETIVDINIVKPELNKILNMSNNDFKLTYKKTACGWRGKKIIQRNANIALKNSQNLKK